MSRPLHHMDFLFQTKLGTYPLAAQCDMLAEQGYQGLAVSAWSKELQALPRVKERWGLDVGALFLIYRQGLEPFVTNIFETVEGTASIELALHSGVIERRGLRLALYPHLKHVYETTTQMRRLCEHFNHPRLGLVFNSYTGTPARKASCSSALRLSGLG